MLALRVVAKKLRPCFQAHQVTILKNHPLKVTLHKPDLSGRMMKWAIELRKSVMETPQQTSGLETRPWTKEEDQKLFECKSKNRHLSWPEIAMLTELERSRKSMMARPEEQRPRWTEEEDRMLFECKGRNLDLPWPDIAELAGLSRSGKSCRDRWKNHLDPNVKRGNFSQEEDETIIRLHSSHENSWAFIATHLPGRTDNAVKNRWNNHLKNKLIGRRLSRSGKSCRERWKNHLDSNVKRGNFSQEEDETIIRLHSSHGNR
ncbi:hypothetical protein VitviT2T_024076 [Vitis vinifera]|uniref:Uncharacterized protein n=1 Tax=Vitis vinifera TaxID=29760 RepID=A0ABY9DEM9_VITVI|nr:hypothetical protein VitviT2T_024076 [Vitis vinifera]